MQQLGADTRASLHALDSRVAAVEQQCAAVRDAAPRWDAGVQAQRALASVAQLNAATAQFEATQQKMWDDFQVWLAGVWIAFVMKYPCPIF